jgi:serine/threonine protein kinase
MQPHTTELIELGTVLGSGSFSHVLKLVDKQDSADDVFIKVPQYHHLRHCLEQEAEALKDLCDNRCIPKLYDTNCPIKTLHINLRCETSAVPCLPMRGHIGRSAMQHQNWDRDKLEFLVLEVYGALEYANSKGWAHLDVQPSNIVTCVDPYSGCLNVMLVDWGCARRTSLKRNGFIGCAPFSHNDLFDETIDWYPCLEHDVASLAYTMAFLSEGGIIPSWQGGFTNCRDVQDYNKEYRFETVRDILKPFFQTGNASQKFKQALFNAIDHPGSNGGKQKKAKTSM